ncbi:MAG TPA: aminoacyl-tRNA hydrolase [Acidimicrobiaceae bacterium]|jgi:PTH1 family peptidyl-tRNA hydrolase|nr:aminoacyl-tRNA hydrolase [Acidimicrobiaceae bacterium]
MAPRRGFGKAAVSHTTTPWDLLVLGLGNPGAKYRGTVHNVGVEVIETVAQRGGTSFKKSRNHALVAELRIGSARVALAFPQTFMNESGRAAGPLVRHYGIVDLERLLVVHDELDLEPGRLKLKFGGGLAGHNGLKSISAHLHTNDYSRLRVGVGKPPGGAQGGISHVLGAPSKRDRELIDVAVQEAADAVELLAHETLEHVMGRFNQR